MANDQLSLFLKRWQDAGLPMDADLEKALHKEVGRLDDLVDQGKVQLPDLVYNIREKAPDIMEDFENDGEVASTHQLRKKHKARRKHKKAPRPPLPF
jgi:hypothetical protein